MTGTSAIRSGLYLITLTSDDLISVNADRSEIAERCITVNSRNCKFGRADNLARRKREYLKIFGEANATFEVLATINNPERIERKVLERLKPHRIAGSTGRLNEWLQNVTPSEVRRIVREVVEAAGEDAALGRDLPLLGDSGTDPARTVVLIDLLARAGLTDVQFGRVHHKHAETMGSHRNYCLKTSRFRPQSSNARVQLRLSVVAVGLEQAAPNPGRPDFDALIQQALIRFPL